MSQMTTKGGTQWLAKYENAGGALVMAAAEVTVYADSVEVDLRGRCAGCGDLKEDSDEYFSPVSSDEIGLSEAARNVKTWAQTHAKKCTALSR